MKGFYTLDTGRTIYNINPSHIQSVELEGIEESSSSSFQPWIRLRVRVTSGDTTSIALEKSREEFDRGLKFLIQLHRDGYLTNDSLTQSLNKIKRFFVIQIEDRIYELEQIEAAQLAELDDLIKEPSVDEVNTLIDEVVELQKLAEVEA